MHFLGAREIKLSIGRIMIGQFFSLVFSLVVKKDLFEGLVMLALVWFMGSVVCRKRLTFPMQLRGQSVVNATQQNGLRTLGNGSLTQIDHKLSSKLLLGHERPTITFRF